MCDKLAPPQFTDIQNTLHDLQDALLESSTISKKESQEFVSVKGFWGPNTGDREATVTIGSEELEKLRADLKDYQWFVEQINRYVIPGEADTRDAALILFKNLSNRVAALEEHKKILFEENGRLLQEKEEK